MDMDMDTEEEQYAMDTVQCDDNKRYTSVFLTEEDSAKLKEIADYQGVVSRELLDFESSHHDDDRYDRRKTSSRNQRQTHDMAQVYGAGVWHLKENFDFLLRVLHIHLTTGELFNPRWEFDDYGQFDELLKQQIPTLDWNEMRYNDNDDEMMLQALDELFGPLE